VFIAVPKYVVDVCIIAQNTADVNQGI
jgi:hypothetical protein